MKDKAGAWISITVGCRVAECDLDFGDGTVESITVPLSGGSDGVNVGVAWDDTSLDGPAWSEAWWAFWLVV